MSSKKDKFSSKDKYFMNIAINLASTINGYTGHNPSVGCVIVKNNKIISFGSTSFFGRPHAEINALSKTNDSKGSTVYLTLEPCTHYGKTPPCTKALIKAKIKKVIYSIEDSDHRTANKAKKILNKNKIIVSSGLLKNRSKNLYKNYNFSKKNLLPYVIGKLACSNNFKIFNNSKVISNKHSNQVTHLLRSKNQAILTTYKTINIDNPKLNCRILGKERFSPFKFIVDRDLKIKIDSHILHNGNKTFIFHSSINNSKLNYLKSIGVKTYFMKREKNNFLDLLKILRNIYKLGLTSVIIEAGPNFLSRMLKENLINEFYLFKSDKSISKYETINVNNIIKFLHGNYSFSKKVNTYLDKDILLHYY
tara:strand:+ start:1833 stop:2924 length:1092 start_codon:yes stop_codon:yes gene_type:complete